MVKQTLKLSLIILLSMLIFACGTGKKVELDVELNVILDGKPAPQAKVTIDGVEAGVTDGNGYFSQRLNRQPGTQVQLSVHKEAAGYQIEPWKDAFVTKLPKGSAVEKYPFKAYLKATKYFTILVTGKGEPLDYASIRINDKLNVKTDENGEYVHSYKVVPKKGMKLSVTKQGYTTWLKRIRVKPGQHLEVSLVKKEKVVKETVAIVPVQKEPLEQMSVAAVKEERVEPTKAAAKKKPEKKAVAPKPKVKKVTVSIATRSDAYGVSKGIAGVAVSINNKPIGKTNAKGLYTYIYKGKPGKKAQIKLSAPGYIPAKWEKSIELKGRPKINRFFYPAKPKPIKVGIYGYVNNTPEEDLTEILNSVEESISNDLFTYSGFKEVPKPKIREQMLQASLDMETVSTEGWQKTSLVRSVDVIIAGSVTKDDQGMTIETTVMTADGKIILSQINKARKKKYIKNTAKVIANSIIDQFPFEGAVAAIDSDGYKINLGKDDHKIRRGNEFRYLSAKLDASGRIKGYREAGMLRVIKTDGDSSWAEIVELKQNEEIKIGDKVVRRVFFEEGRAEADAFFTLYAKGGLPPDEAPLWGVNVYLNNTWVGTTGTNGKVKVPVRLYQEYDLLLSRYGFQPLEDAISIGESKQLKEFILDVASAMFKVESEPSGAQVFVDGTEIGATPMLDGQMVNFGFRKIKLSVGGEYRDWEEVLEFAKPEMERIGENKIVFIKDYLKIGKSAEQNGKIDAAIQAYSSTEKGNPDYSDARHRLAQLYMDDKRDYDGAIREFENVLSLPENQQIIYKQFAVTYTNLGHAYYEMGKQLIRKDKKAAASHFGKAIKNLRVAKQNTRFFPNNQFEEAVHDTYYYRALSYHKLYLVTKKRTLIHRADLAWREYFDFFPKKLEGNKSFVQMRNSARRYYAQIKDLK
jgi:tetratricopeptide (TPR) repeat protein